LFNNIVKFLKYFMKYFRVKKFIKFYITNQKTQKDGDTEKVGLCQKLANCSAAGDYVTDADIVSIERCHLANKN